MSERLTDFDQRISEQLAEILNRLPPKGTA
jgi:hypothetical protein